MVFVGKRKMKKKEKDTSSNIAGYVTASEKQIWVVFVSSERGERRNRSDDTNEICH